MPVKFNESFTYKEIECICFMCDFINSISQVPDFTTGNSGYDLTLKEFSKVAVEIRNRFDEVVNGR